MPESKIRSLNAPLAVQLAHLLLSSVWNLVGVFLLNRGLAALGPTASINTVALLLALALLMVIGARKNAYLYIATSLATMAGASLAIAGAFSHHPSMWPSEFWRFAGVSLNSLALIGGAWGLTRLYFFAKKKA